MASFTKLWGAHVGRANVCDSDVFDNQCAMRMGAALEDCGISLAGKNLKRCTDYSSKFKSHKPGHIRSAQELANVFYRSPSLLGAGVKRQIFTGNINKNLSSFKGRQGLVFIMNGWGSTDHIDLWDGSKMELKGAYSTATYRTRGQQVWFWELKS